MPQNVRSLIEMVKIRWLAEKLCIEKLTLKNGVLKAYFVTEGNDIFFQSDKFGKIIAHIQKNPQRYALKDLKNKLLLTCQNVPNVSEWKGVLTELSFEKDV